MIRCGWCGGDTAPDRCSLCGRDPALPYVQRGQEPPVVDAAELARRKLDEAAKAIEASGRKVTAAAVAEHHDVDERTVRRWRADVRPTP